MAITERYVRSDAAGGGDGTTDAASGANGSFTWAEMITDLNTPRAGYRYNVKAGTYTLAATTTLTGDGTTTSPNIIRGFNSTAGDLDAQGRSSGGALDTTNFPVIAYNSTYQLNAGGSDYLILQNLKITGSRAGTVLTTPTTGGVVVRCYVENTQNNASAGGLILQSGMLLDSDVFASGAAGDYAINPSAGGGTVMGCRAKCVGGVGIKCATNAVIVGNTVYECGGAGITSTSTSNVPRILSNTIVNCTSDGINYVASTTGALFIVNNHITGCADAVEFTATCTCQKVLAFNRTRDNTNALVGSDDWTAGTTIDHVTSDDTDALDFTDASTDDYSLKAGAAATSQGPGYLVDIGANGTPVVTGGAGGLITHPGMTGGING